MVSLMAKIRLNCKKQYFKYLGNFSRPDQEKQRESGRQRQSLFPLSLSPFLFSFSIQSTIKKMVV